MPIPCQDLRSESSGAAGYLKFLPRVEKNLWLGALFIMNACGEPLEFTHARVRSPNPLLWRVEDLRMCCLESLCKSMFEICPVVPDVMFYLTGEVDACLFAERINSEVPVGMVGQDAVSGDVLTNWITEPEINSPPDKLYNCLSMRGLLLEPFARAEAGLREVYSELLR